MAAVKKRKRRKKAKLRGEASPKQIPNPNGKPQKLLKFQARFTEKDLNRIRMLAHIYAGGNVSRWIAYAALNVERVYLVKKTFDWDQTE